MAKAEIICETCPINQSEVTLQQTIDWSKTEVKDSEATSLTMSEKDLASRCLFYRNIGLCERVKEE